MKIVRMILLACVFGGALSVIGCADQDGDDEPRDPEPMSCSASTQCQDACGGRDCPTVCNIERRVCECRCPG
jgi:hypothetical protein